MIIFFWRLNEATRFVKFIEGMPRATNDFLGHIDDPLESLPVCYGATSKPNKHTLSEDALYHPLPQNVDCNVIKCGRVQESDYFASHNRDF